MARKEISVKRGGGTLGSLVLCKKKSDTVAWKVTPAITSTQTLSVVSSDPSIVPSSSVTGSSTLDVTPVYTSRTTVTYTVYVDSTPEGNGSLVIDTIGTGGGSGMCEDDGKEELYEVVHHSHGSDQ
jgi:hypothetical protein